jgi:ASC-1-like (ASCH) protein
MNMESYNPVRIITTKKIPFEQITNNHKKIEIRINTGIFESIKYNDYICFKYLYNLDIKRKVLMTKIYRSFRDCIIDNFKNLKLMNPLSNSIEDSLNIYIKPNGIYSLEKEKLGVIAIYFE